MERVHMAGCYFEIYTANISKLKEVNYTRVILQDLTALCFVKMQRHCCMIPLINLLKPWCAETQYRTDMNHFSS